MTNTLYTSLSNRDYLFNSDGTMIVDDQRLPAAYLSPEVAVRVDGLKKKGVDANSIINACRQVPTYDKPRGIVVYSLGGEIHFSKPIRSRNPDFPQSLDDSVLELFKSCDNARELKDEILSEIPLSDGETPRQYDKKPVNPTKPSKGLGDIRWKAR